ncbi:MAG: hypothetical protein WC812_04405 [Candidatus Pacearchaeota archaeon]|jgi:hypothetical protein
MLKENTIYKLGSNDSIYLPDYDLFQDGHKVHTLASFLLSKKNIDAIILRIIEKTDPCQITEKNRISFENNNLSNKILIPELFNGEPCAQFQELEKAYKKLIK